jgi:hypothetical protein
MGPSNIPSATETAQNTASQSVDVISELMHQANDADRVSAQATKVASIPISGGHQAPGAAMLPGNPNFQKEKFDTSPVVGKHNATMRGIVNLSKGVSNLVGEVDQTVAQKKTQRLAVNMERLMGATQSMDEAKQTLAQDPNNAAAIDQLKKSNAIADEVLSDAKVRKSISKAYNINFTDPSKNNTPEHAALKMATDNYSKQFQDQLPQKLAPNEQAIQEAKLAQATAAGVRKTVDAIVPKLIDQQTHIAQEGMRQAGADNRETKKEEFAWTNARKKAEEDLGKVLAVAETNGRNHLKLAMFNQDRIDKRFFAGLDEKMKSAGGNIKDMKTSDLQHALTEADSIEKSDPQSLTNLISVRDNIQKDQKKYDKNDLEQANQAIYYFKQNQKAHNEARTTIQAELTRRLTGGGSSDSPNNSTKRSGTSSTTKEADATGTSGTEPADDEADDSSTVNSIINE